MKKNKSEHEQQRVMNRCGSFLDEGTIMREIYDGRKMRVGRKLKEAGKEKVQGRGNHFSRADRWRSLLHGVVFVYQQR